MKKVVLSTETFRRETVRYILDNSEKKLIKKLLKREGYWFKGVFQGKPRFFTFQVRRNYDNQPKEILMVVVDFACSNSHVERVSLTSDWRFDFQGQPTWVTPNAIPYSLNSMIYFGYYQKVVSIKNPFKKHLNFS